MSWLSVYRPMTFPVNEQRERGTSRAAAEGISLKIPALRTERGRTGHPPSLNVHHFRFKRFQALVISSHSNKTNLIADPVVAITSTPLTIMFSMFTTAVLLDLDKVESYVYNV